MVILVLTIHIVRFSKYPLMACLDAAYPNVRENVSSCDTANHSDTTTIILLKWVKLAGNCYWHESN
jgi:hypothetical protein